jgi:hypothetical protein
MALSISPCVIISLPCGAEKVPKAQKGPFVKEAMTLRIDSDPRRPEALHYLFEEFGRPRTFSAWLRHEGHWHRTEGATRTEVFAAMYHALNNCRQEKA